MECIHNCLEFHNIKTVLFSYSLNVTMQDFVAAKQFYWHVDEVHGRGSILV